MVWRLINSELCSMKSQETTYNNMPQRIDEILSVLRELKSTVTNLIEKRDNIPKYLNIDATVDYLKSLGILMSKSKIYKMSASGELPVVKIENKIYLTPKIIELWLLKIQNQ